MSPKSLFLFIALISQTGAIALAQSVPTGARITDVRTRGSGCPQAQAAVVLSPDLKDLSVFFDSYSVEIGQGSSHANLLSLTKECQIQIQLQVPEGWQMAFKGVDYRGFVALSNQGSAFHRFSIFPEGAPIVSMKEAMLKGPINQDYYVRSEIKPERVTWSACLRSLTNIQLVSQLGVSLNPRSADRSLTQIALDSADTSFKQSISVDWRRCSPAGGGGGGIIRPDPRPRPRPGLPSR